jgi:hypothetical protein
MISSRPYFATEPEAKNQKSRRENRNENEVKYVG